MNYDTCWENSVVVCLGGENSKAVPFAAHAIVGPPENYCLGFLGFKF